MCTFDRCNNPKCQKCVRVTMIILAVFLLIQVILGIMKYVNTASMADADVVKKILEMVFENDPSMLDTIKSFLQLAGLVLMAITFVGVICGCCTICCARKCKCGNACCTKFGVSLSTYFWIGFAVFWFIAGGIMLAPKNAGVDWIDERCADASKGDYSKMGQEKEMFQSFVTIDNTYASGVNAFMCSDFCICPGTPSDPWYKAYKAVPEAKYNKYKRTWNTNAPKFQGEPVLNRGSLYPGENTPLTWAHYPSNYATASLQNKQNGWITVSSESVLDCIDNIDVLVSKYAQKELEKQEARYGRGSTQAQSQTNTNKDKFKDLGKSVKSANNELSKVKDFIKFMEDKYKCGGLCNPPMWYLTKSLKTGLPEKGCVAPLIADIGDVMASVGNVMIASGVFFLLMIFCVCPMCCYHHADKGTTPVTEVSVSYGQPGGVKVYQEGGSLEMSDSQEIGQFKKDNTVNPCIQA